MDYCRSFSQKNVVGWFCIGILSSAATHLDSVECYYFVVSYKQSEKNKWVFIGFKRDNVIKKNYPMN